MADHSRTLIELYRALRARFGPQHWWPAQGPPGTALRALEICLGAILTQNTNWSNVVKALSSLAAAGCMDVDALHRMELSSLAALIRPAGYFNVKARRLKSFLDRLHERGGDILEFLDQPAAVLRDDLLSVHGIGPETADSMILYAAGKPVFVVDAYTRRMLLRHGLIGPRASYEEIRALFEAQLPRRTALWNDYHAQIVALGKHYCRPKARCEGCPLEGFPHDRFVMP